MGDVRMAGVLVVLISGPIASGKSTLSRAVASQMEKASGASVAVIDLDLVYEMLDRGPKADERIWTEARRITGRLASVLLGEGRSVVVEGGDFDTDAALAEFESELPPQATVRPVLLSVDFETALKRARSDDSRGVSKDRVFLAAHYAEFRTDWLGRDALNLDTGTASLAETARSVVDWLALTH
ncbi:MAG: adenylyl-sulfate kinase [Gaiellaceae bacterium]|jgi:shikimate kinase